MLKIQTDNSNETEFSALPKKMQCTQVVLMDKFLHHMFILYVTINYKLQSPLVQVAV